MSLLSSRRRALLLVLGLLVALGTALAPTTAHAHDVLVASEPQQDQTLTEPPEHVTLTFNNAPLDVGSAIVVVDGSGETVAEGEGTVAGTDVRLELDPPLPAGEYEVRWRVASSDGHPIEGTIPFAVDAPAAPEQTADPAPTGTPDAAAGPTAVPTETAAEPTPAASPTTSQSGLAGLPTWLKIAIGLAALGSVAGLVVLTARRMRGDR